jgi:hypothetical protein
MQVQQERQKALRNLKKLSIPSRKPSVKPV